MSGKCESEKIGVCGDDCNYCLRYKATISNDQMLLARVKELWVSLGWRRPDVDIEELKCRGCTKENRCAYEKLRDCAFGKKLKNCGMCPDYPCSLTENAFARTEMLYSRINAECSKEDWNLLEKAFRYKKENLDKINIREFSKDRE